MSLKTLLQKCGFRALDCSDTTNLLFFTPFGLQATGGIAKMLNAASGSFAGTNPTSCHSQSMDISDFESKMDHLVRTGPGSEVVALPCVAAVKQESFPLCEAPEELSLGLWAADDCFCREEDQVFDWVWDEYCKSSGASLSCDNRKVSFHSDYSCGTAAIRGNRELSDGQHYWEVKMTSPVYGTDMVRVRFFRLVKI
ncbi:hypothetical protein XENORESO_017127 [Xenotaenia resolanae]|uniref:B30.2/SPRY domain-containing protein n=1 Tax=Xenotaenia resolanae TaxID=208358 RepID=A0ABV0WZL0_9TELE